MEILLLTVFLSLLLAGLFLMFFLKDRQQGEGHGFEQEALRPFQPEQPNRGPKA